MNIEKKSRPEYNINNFRTWDNYDSDKKMLMIVEDAYCINCQEYHIPNKEGKCPNCKVQLNIIELPKTQDNLKDMGVELKETQHAHGAFGKN